MRKSTIGGKKLIIQLGREETLFALWDKGPSFLHTFTLPTPEGAVDDGEILDMNGVRDLLNTALAMPELQKVRNVIFALCTSQVISETISTPEMPRKKLGKLIHANIDMYFPVDMTDYHLIWQVIGTKVSNAGLKEQSVQLWAIPSAMLAPYYTIANECGLSVAAIDYCGNSIATAVGASFSENKKKARAKIDFNKEISFGRKKAAAAEAEAAAPVAVAEPDTVEVTDLHLTLDKDLIGITFVQNNIVTHQRFIRSGSNPAYQFDEVAMMVEYFRSLDMERNREFIAMVSGQLANDTYLVDELSFALDMPLTKFTPDYDSCWVVCAGAAQTALDFGNAELNNPIKNANPKVGQVAQTAVLTAGAAALAGVVALTVVARFSWNATIDSLEARRQNLAIQLQKVAGFADRYNEYATLYDNYSHDWNTIRGNLRTYNDNLVRVLEELEDIMPRKTSVTALAINNDGLEVQFACDNKEDAAYLIMALRELQYAKLNNITSLTGGGRGAATSYGNGEKAPTEGSSDWLTEEQNATLSGMLAEEFNTYEVICAFLEKEDLLRAMEANFGYMPSTDITLDDDKNPDTPDVTIACSTISEIENIYSTVITSGRSITFNMREAAITALLDTNPFSGARFVNQMLDGMNNHSEEAPFFFYFELMAAYMNGNIKYGTPDEVEATIDRLINIVTTNEQYLSEAEKLIRKDSALEKWYVHYLEEQISKKVGYDVSPEEEDYNPIYLDMKKMMDDLLDNAQFNTSNRKLNSELYYMLDDATIDYIEWLIENKPIPTPPTEVTPTPTPPTEVTPTPTPPTEVTPTPTPPTEVTPTPTPPIDPDRDAKIKSYLTTGTSEDSAMDAWLDAYITTGDSGNVDMTIYLNGYFTGPYAEKTMQEIFADYLLDGDMVNKVLEDAVEWYMDSGDSGSTVMDSFYDRAIDLFAKNEWPEYEDVEPLLDKYYSSAATSDDVRFDKLMARWKGVGSTGSAHLDSIIEKYNSEVEVDPELSLDELIKKYIKEGTTGTPYDPLLDAYIRTGTTNNQQYDMMIGQYISSKNYDETTKEVVAEYLDGKKLKNKPLHEAMDLFMNPGKSANPVIDDLLYRSFELYAIETWPSYDKIKGLLDTYYASKTSSGDKRLDQLLKRLQVTQKSTGSTYLDNMIQKYYNEVFLSGDKDKVQNVVNGSSDKESDKSGGGNGQPTDTRVSFTVSLGYNEQLMGAELDRRGFSSDSMIDKQEVN